MNLYNIAQDILNALDCVDEETGELSDDVMNALFSKESDFEDKCVNIGYVIKNLEAEAQAVKNAMDEMKSRHLRLLKKVDSLSAYLLTNMQTVGKDKIEKSPHFVISIRKNPASVNITDESIIDVKYVKEKVTTTIDKVAIKDDLNNGKPVNGAELINKMKVVIK